MGLSRALLFDCLGLALSAVAAVLLPRWSRLVRVLWPKLEVKNIVETRAELEFYRGGVDRQPASDGVLLMISFSEQQVVVLANSRVSAKLPRDIWKQLINRLIVKIKSGQLADGYCEAIREIGEMVRKDFPAKARQTNKLSNRLIIRDR